MTGPRSRRSGRRGPFFLSFFFCLSAQQHSNRTGYPRCAILKQGMYMEVFSKVYYDRVYFLRAERFMTGSGFQPPSGTPRPFESRVPPTPRVNTIPIFPAYCRITQEPNGDIQS